MQIRSLLFVIVLLSAACRVMATDGETSVSSFKIVTLGDSITNGVRAGVTEAQTFSALLSTRLKRDGVDCEVINAGIGGERTDMALLRLDKIIELRPRFVTIMYGTNDSYVDVGKKTSRITAAAYEQNLIEIVARLLRAGIEPVLMTEPRWAAETSNNGAGEHPNVRLTKYMMACRRVASSLDIPLVDNFDAWTKAESDGQKIQEWTTDNCHPNAAGHVQLTTAIQPVLNRLLNPEFVPVGYKLVRETVMEEDKGEYLWYHARSAPIPQTDGLPNVILTLQKHLYTSDHYAGINTMMTNDFGKTWSGPTAEPALGWVHEDGVDVAVADVTPGWHSNSGKILAVGAQVRYSKKGKQLEDQVRSNQTAYAVFDPETKDWTKWRQLEIPEGKHFNMARSACAQFIVEPNGDVLLPFYHGEGTSTPFSSTVVRCTFDGTTLKYVENGNVMALSEGRGIYEPSMTQFEGRYFLTMRSDDHAYVTVSDDGMNYRPVKRWHFDDGGDLGSYNTQQHWVTQNGGLFLVYTRRGANNDHIARHRAPLFIAQVDPQRLHVVRDTEQVVFPERGALMGNSGAVSVTADESWVTVSEGLFNEDARRRGGVGATLLGRVQSSQFKSPGAPTTNEKLTDGAEPINIVCFGDSVTGLYYHTGGRRTYTDLLGTALRRLHPRAEVTMHNAGISGHTTEDGLRRIDKDVLQRNPSLVTVMFGLNDMVRVPLPNYRANLVKIVNQIRAVGSEVVLCTPNSVTTTDSRPTEKLEQYCEVVRQVAAELKVTLCDCYADYQNQREKDSSVWRLFMSDEIHPNLNGHRRIAEVIAQTVTGQEVSLTDITALRPALPFTFAQLKKSEPIRVLAMAPYDEVITEAIQSIQPDAKVEVTRWETAGMTMADLEQDARNRVRPMKPHLVILSPPREVTATSTEGFIRSFTWLMNWSLSYNHLEWDAVVVHPEVASPVETAAEFDELIRQLVAAQDLTLIDRNKGDATEASAIFERWFKHAWKYAPQP